MRVLVIGSGVAVRSELAMVNRADFDTVIGVNRAAVEFRPVDIHCSLHPRDFAPIKAAYMVSHADYRGVDEIFDCLWRVGGTSGSSGLYAVKYALERLGADHIVLAGVGMDEGPHFYNPSKWHQATRFQREWVHVLPKIRGKVTSLGGWTAELLNGGQPLNRRATGDISAACCGGF